MIFIAILKETKESRLHPVLYRGGDVAQLVERWLQEAYEVPARQVRFLAYITLDVCVCPSNSNSKVAPRPSRTP